MRRTVLASLAAGAGWVALVAGPAGAEDWFAQPIDVHEWGVHVFDWTGKEPPEDLPSYLHRPADAPAAAVTRFSPPVVEMPADSGVRRKPVLYFYPPAGGGSGDVPVALDLDFARGTPSVWYPQADRVGDEKDASGPALRWTHLKLTKDPPAGIALPGADLPADHWAKLARDVDAACVTNGVEAERYVFYDGATSERAAVTAERDAEGMWRLANRSERPVCDLFLVERSGDRQAVAHLDRIPARETAAVRAAPFAPGAAGFGEATSSRLRAALVRGQPKRDERAVTMRNPAEPQGPTTDSWLHPKEADGFVRIWRKDFFEGEGVRLVYREDPSALDAAMPLKLFTDMHHYIRLSRVGFVLVIGADHPPAGDAPPGRRR